MCFFLIFIIKIYFIYWKKYRYFFGNYLLFYCKVSLFENFSVYYRRIFDEVFNKS